MKSPQRPYLSEGVQALEVLVEKNKSNKDTLNAIAHELSFRKTHRAICLAKVIAKHLAEPKSAETSTTTTVFSDQPVAESLELAEWDPEQKVVIELDEETASLVEAGPGSGKTAVACARVARLVEERGLEPGKILLISFTRAAVKELRDRIESYAKHPVNIAGLNIATLDSLTWQVVRGLTSEETTKLLESYEGNIGRFVDLLKRGDTDLLDYISELQHVVIDEGQDLVTVRADLVVNLIQRLQPHCGVTVFADSAQAIYGFTDDVNGSRGGGSVTLADRIYLGELDSFQSLQLKNIHRTKDLRLMDLYRLGREKLVKNRTGSIDDWLEIKGDIENLSHRSTSNLDAESLKDRSDSLILFRTRAEALMQSSMLWAKGIENKLRMSGVPSRIHPWIGRLFSQFNEDHVTKQEFENLWNNRIGTASPVVTSSINEAWEMLLDNAGERNDKVDVRRLRTILSRENPPTDFILEEKYLPGPVIGTIHASKGREADRVFLMMPADGFMNNKQDAHQIAEEERVLFVGATRARRELVTGTGFRTYSSTLDQSGRAYRIKGVGAQIEIGRNRDFDIVSVAGQRMSEQSASELQEWFWLTAAKDVALTAIYDRSRKANILWTVDGDRREVGGLSQSFAQDLFSVATIVGNMRNKHGLHPSGEIRHIRMVGVRTVVIPPALRDGLLSPWSHSGFLLVPVISAFTMVYFKQ